MTKPQDPRLEEKTEFISFSSALNLSISLKSEFNIYLITAFSVLEMRGSVLLQQLLHKTPPEEGENQLSSAVSEQDIQKSSCGQKPFISDALRK